jgi:hypothetical protein
MKKHMIDPPSGWLYGFPKELPEGVENVLAWLVENGYPQKEIDNLGEHFYCRHWYSEEQAEIEASKRPNNVVGVPCDELKKMQDRLAHLEKMVVWYQDITMTGINSEEYEKGFWDAVDFVKQHQVKDKN